MEICFLVQRKVPHEAVEDAQHELEEMLVERLVGLGTSVSELNLCDLTKRAPSIHVHVFKKSSSQLNEIEARINSGILMSVRNTSLFDSEEQIWEQMLQERRERRESCQQEQPQPTNQQQPSNQPTNQNGGFKRRTRRILRYIRKKLVICARP